MKETSSIKERLIENMKEEYPLNVEYIKSYLPNYGLPVMGVFLSNGFPKYVNLEDGPKDVDQAVMYIDVESLKTILNATDEVSVSDAVFMDGIIRFLKYYRPVSLVYRKSGMTDGKVLLNILERVFEICPPIAPLQDIKAAASALIYERDDEAVREASFKAPIGAMIRRGIRQIAEKLYPLKGLKVYGKLSYIERPYLPDYDFITIEKRYEDRPIDSLIIVETDGFLEKVNSYYKGKGNLGDLILIYSLLRSFIWDDTPTVEDEAESIDAVQKGTWKVPSDECSDKDVLKEIIKKSFDAKGIKVEELLENAKDYNTKNLIHSLTSDTKLSFKHFRELLKLVSLEFLIGTRDNKAPLNHYIIYDSSADQTRCVKFDPSTINGPRGINRVFCDDCSNKDVLKEIIKKSFYAKGIKVEELLEDAEDYNTKNLIHSLKTDNKLSFKNFRELIELADLQFSLGILDSEVPPKFYTIYRSSTDSTECTTMDSLIDNGARYKGFDDDYDENYNGFDKDDLSDNEDDEDEEEDSDTEYVDCPVTMIVRIKKSDIGNLKRIENHIEEFVDLDSWPEIEYVSDVHVDRIEDPSNLSFNTKYFDRESELAMRAMTSIFGLQSFGEKITDDVDQTVEPEIPAESTGANFYDILDESTRA